MADQYIATTNVDTFVGSVVREELCTDDDVYSTAVFVGLAEAATSVIQAAMRNSGYSTPATVTDPYIVMGTVGVWMELAYSRPEKELVFPESWDNHIAKRAAEDILSGDAMLNLAKSTVGAIGGVRFSDYGSSYTTAQGGRNPTFSRKNMAGF